MLGGMVPLSLGIGVLAIAMTLSATLMPVFRSNSFTTGLKALSFRPE